MTLQSNFSVLRWYDTETKETGIAYDFSDKQGILWDVSAIRDDYMIISSFKEDFEDYWRECFFDRETGERWELEDNQGKASFEKAACKLHFCDGGAAAHGGVFRLFGSPCEKGHLAVK